VWRLFIKNIFDCKSIFLIQNIYISCYIKSHLIYAAWLTEQYNAGCVYIYGDFMKTRDSLSILCALLLIGGLALSFGNKHVPLPGPSFACTTFDTTNVVVNSSDCNINNGSITGLQGTGSGTLVYTWYNANNVVVGNSSDLLAVPAGSYTVMLKDSSKCPAVTLTYTIGIRNPASIDYASAVITSPGCNQNNGSITNINTGNAISYQWMDGNNAVVSTSKDLLNVAAGVYVLTVTNATGCKAQARYIINPGAYAPILTYYTTTPSDCKATGIFGATFNFTSTDPSYFYQITNAADSIYSSGQLAYNPADSTRIKIANFPSGTYNLTTQSPSGCLTKILTFTIGQVFFALDTSKAAIAPDICGQNTGSIANIQLIGPAPTVDKLKGPTKDIRVGYFWLDSTGKRVSDQLFLGGVPSGKYSLYAVNDDLCTTSTVTFFIPDSISAATKPLVNDIKICLPGTVGLNVLNQEPGAHYRLYDSTQTLIDTSVAGYFVRKVAVTTVFYISSIKGICPSPLAKVTVTVVDPGVSFPNAFTPNNDGINDYWQITGLDQYPGTEVSVFNRYGQRVYHSINYSTPFNGQENGRNLPDGVYYYIIDTKKPDCRAGVSGSLTIIR